MSTHTIEQFCRILCCGISDIMEMRNDDGTLIACSLLGIPQPYVPADEAAETEAAVTALLPSGPANTAAAMFSSADPDLPGSWPVPSQAIPAGSAPEPLAAAAMPPYPTSYQATQDIRLVYKPFWKTLKLRNISQRCFARTFGVSTGQLDRLRKNDYITTQTILKLCHLLNCSFCDIMELQDKNGTAFPPSVLAEEMPEVSEHAAELGAVSDISGHATHEKII